MTTTPKPKEWTGLPPDRCDLCSDPITDEFIDGRTTEGPWANMCPECHQSWGMGCGTGHGQRYRLTDGRWLKTEG